MTFAEESLPNLLRATATIVRITHGPDCPDPEVHRRAADLLERVADAEEAGAPLRAGERESAIRTAHTYLTANEPVKAGT